MSDMPWVRFYASDWLAGTRGMTASQTGVYITLIAHMYERGQPLALDMSFLARLCGASNSSFKVAFEFLKSENKIQVSDDGVWNDRVGKELSYSRGKQEVGRQAAKSRWGKKSNEINHGHDANAMQSQCERNANQKPESEPERKKEESLLSLPLEDDVPPKPKLNGKKRTVYSDRFEAFWTMYPRTPTMSKAEAWKEWQKRSGEEHDAIVSALKPYTAYLKANDWQKAVHACRFISQERFEGFVGDGSSEGFQFVPLDDAICSIQKQRFIDQHGKEPEATERNGTRGLMLPAQWVHTARESMKGMQ